VFYQEASWMAPASQPITVAELRRRLEQMEKPAGQALAALPFGVSEVDARLPGAGLTLGHLHEVIEGGAAGEYAGLAALFAAGILARHPGPVLWCLRGRDLFAPALARVGLHPDRVIYCETWRDAEVLPAMEEGVRCKGLAGVVGEVIHLSLNASRRLQLCAGETGVTALAIRRWRNTTEKKLAGEPNAAASRWRVSPHPSPHRFDGLPRQHWKVELLRVRGGEAHSWILEACDAKGYLALPAALAERSAPAEELGIARAG
jgi:protein ImuA